jgi:hypothetical protein
METGNGRLDSFLKGTDFMPFKKGHIIFFANIGFKRHKACAFYFSRTLGLIESSKFRPSISPFLKKDETFGHR